jgi:hypothetical protein
MTEQAIALPPPDFPDTESYTDATMRECVRQAVLAEREAIEAQRIAAFEAGWRMAAEWAKRDDLNADMDSPAYIAERKAALSNLFGLVDAAIRASAGKE